MHRHLCRSVKAPVECPDIRHVIPTADMVPNVSESIAEENRWSVIQWSCPLFYILRPPPYLYSWTDCTSSLRCFSFRDNGVGSPFVTYTTFPLELTYLLWWVTFTFFFMFFFVFDDGMDPAYASRGKKTNLTDESSLCCRGKWMNGLH